MRTHAVVSMGAAVAAAGLSVGWGVPAPPAQAVAVATRTVLMTSDDTFSPRSATVVRGTVVRWRNASTDAHTTTSSRGLWDARVAPGSSFSRTFGRTGTFRYRCRFHSDMVGRIVVVAP